MLPLGGFVVALWWGRGASSRSRLLMAAGLGALVVTAPAILDAILQAWGWPSRSPTILVVLGTVALWSLDSVIRGPQAALRLGCRPADSEIIAEVDRLRRQLGGPALEVLVGPPVGLKMYAGADSLTRPFIVLTNGVLHSLEPAERRAVLGHEVAHHATRSLWYLAGVPALASALALMVGPSLSGASLIVVSCVLLLAARPVVSRPIEYLCDAIGARVEGPGAVASGLAKLTRTGYLDHDSRASRILHVFWTHPSTSNRVRRLARQPVSGQLLRDAVGPAVAFGALFLAARLAASSPGILVAVGMTFIIGLLVLYVLARRPDPMKALQKVPVKGRRLLWSLIVAAVCLLCGLIGVVAFDGSDLIGFTLLSLLILAGLMLPVSLLYGGSIPRLRQRLALLLVDAPAELVEEAQGDPKTFRSDPVALHFLALAKWRVGDRAAAEADFKQVAEQWPRFLLPRAVQAELLRRQEPSRALALIQELPLANPEVALSRTLAYLQLGAVDSAAEALQPALAESPVALAVFAARASVALARKHFDEADEILESAAKEGAFSSAGLVILTARVAMARGEYPTAESGLQKAQDLLEAEPLLLLVLERDLLEARRELEAARAAEQPGDIGLPPGSPSR